ncbi:myosin-16-like [Eleginops maclovinus]|uniref:myosin-16-like n=1 Tax=Eleginops maclovinus TaxID=56733 RepID=UPI0030807262
MFLVPTEKQLLDAMNKPYDIKRSCWIKDEKEAFIAGELQSEDGDKVTISTSRNSEAFDVLGFTSEEKRSLYKLTGFKVQTDSQGGTS